MSVSQQVLANFNFNAHDGSEFYLTLLAGVGNGFCCQGSNPVTDIFSLVRGLSTVSCKVSNTKRGNNALRDVSIASKKPSCLELNSKA